MKGDMYTVGEVSKMTGVSKDTLLYYDKINLFKPQYVNPETKYRYYTYKQFWQLDIIICCKNLGIPIPVIRDILLTKDSQKIIEMMKLHQEEAMTRSNYYKKVAEDIDWYVEQYNMVKSITVPSQITVEHFQERRVIYAENENNMKDYHSKFLEATKNVLKRTDSFRRSSGFIMNPEGIEKNKFMKIGEYAEFESDMEDVVNEENYHVIPEGEYACCIVNVVNRDVDFSQLNQWLMEHKIKPELVLMEEIGFQLFDYFAQGYPCRVKVKI